MTTGRNDSSHSSPLTPSGTAGGARERVCVQHFLRYNPSSSSLLGSGDCDSPVLVRTPRQVWRGEGEACESDDLSGSWPRPSLARVLAVVVGTRFCAQRT